MDKQNAIGKRLKQAREAVGMTQVDLAEKVGLAQSYLSSIEAGKKQPSSHLLQEMAELGVSIDYILRGLGHPLFKPSSKSDAYFDVYSDVNFHQKLHFREEPETALTTAVGAVPVVQGSMAAAGSLGGVQEGEALATMPRLVLPGLPTRRGTWVAVYADGESMQPTIAPGDLLVCRLLEDAQMLRQNTVCVVCTPSGTVVKRVSHRPTGLHLACDNTAHPPSLVPYSEVQQLWEVIRRITGYLDPLPLADMRLEARLKALEDRAK
jgi:transcriptional regulator with XRE-family HTH domain